MTGEDSLDQLSAMSPGSNMSFSPSPSHPSPSFDSPSPSLSNSEVSPSLSNSFSSQRLSRRGQGVLENTQVQFDSEVGSAKESPDKLLFDSLAEKAAVRENTRRAPESSRIVELREQRNREGTLKYQRDRLERERLQLPAEERHKTKQIDVEKYIGHRYTRDRSRRRSF